LQRIRRHLGKGARDLCAALLWRPIADVRGRGVHIAGNVGGSRCDAANPGTARIGNRWGDLSIATSIHLEARQLCRFYCGYDWAGMEEGVSEEGP
jgi:hypothetical protein